MDCSKVRVIFDLLCQERNGDHVVGNTYIVEGGTLPGGILPGGIPPGGIPPGGIVTRG